MSKPSLLQGDGFVLRWSTPEDIPALADIEYDHEVKRYLALPVTAKQDWVNKVREIRGYVVDVESLVAGRADLKGWGKRKGALELEVIIARPFWGAKFGRKVAAVLLQCAFTHPLTRTVVAVVHPENKASIAMLRSFKFRRRRTVSNSLHQWQNGHLIYMLSRRAYETLQGESA
jgi:RimJ/RimL family protein N-acetyltransferase